MMTYDKVKSWLTDSAGSAKRIRAMSIITLVLLYPLLCVLYYRIGFSTPLFISFCFSIIVVSFVFAKSEKAYFSSLNVWNETPLVLVIALACAPLYLYLSFDLPYQIGSDELEVVNVCKILLSRPSPDLFGLADTYYHLPSGSFVVNGYLASLLGAVDFENLRRVNGFFGICTIFFSYFFFRLFLPRKPAMFATIMFGCCHSLIALSRLSTRENHCLLIQLVSLIILIPGLRQINSRKLFAGGAILAFSLYTYYPARILPLAWFVFLAIYCFSKFGVGKLFLQQCFRLGLPTLIGFFLAAAPILIASYNSPSNSLNYPKQQLLIYPQGREFVQEWEKVNDLPTAVLRNTVKGLTIFNNNLPDEGSMYWNPGYGFVDFLTGIFLWVGVFAVIRRKKNRDLYLPVITQFAVVWLFISFLTTKNPNYTRLLILLPYAIIFAYKGVEEFAKFIAVFVARQRQVLTYKYRIITAVTILIVALNISNYGNFISGGLRERYAPGATMRYVYSRRFVANTHYYYVSDKQHPYFWFGENAWLYWLKMFTNPDQTVELLLPEHLLNDNEPILLRAPAVLLLSSDLWELSREKVLRQHPNATIYFTSGDRKQIAIEIPN